MSEIVRQSTARIVMVGPILDATGVAVTDGVVGDLKVSKNGAAPAALNGSATLTHRHTGHYSLSLATADVDTVGTAQITIDDTVNAMPPKELTVIEEAVYDAIYAASAPGYLQPATAGRTLVVDAAGLADANVVKLGPTGSGTAQTARDLGASVLLSSGTGTGQLDFTSGIVKSNLSQILGTALTETAGLIAAGFKKFFNVASPTGTVNSLPDAVPGASGGVMIAGSNAATTVNITGNITGNLSGSVGSVTGAVGSVVGHTPQTGDSFARIGAAGAGLTDLGGMSTTMKAQVNVEALDVLATDTFAEPSAVPAATSTLKDKINWMFCLMRNKREQTSTTETAYADNGTTPVATSTKSDNGTTATRGEWT